MDSKELLYINTVKDIEKRLKSNDEYEILGISALIRKLFLDGGNSLVDQVNRKYKIKLEFIIGEIDTPYNKLLMSHNPSYWILCDGLDPNTKLVAGGQTKLKRDEFFSTVVLILDGEKYTIRDIVKFEANIMGAVHSGKPNNLKERGLDGLNKILEINNMRSTQKQIISIGRVVLVALSQLSKNI